MQQRVHHRAEQIAVAAGEMTVAYQIDHRPQFVVVAAERARIVAIGPAGLHLLGGQAEQEEVLRSDLFADFHIGAVQCADGERAVHRELHVAGAGRFLAGGGDLFGEIRRRIDTLAVGDVVIGQEHHLKAICHHRILVYHLAHGIDQLDHEFGKMVAGRGLAAEDKGARLDVCVGVGLDAVV